MIEDLPPLHTPDRLLQPSNAAGYHALGDTLTGLLAQDFSWSGAARELSEAGSSSAHAASVTEVSVADVVGQPLARKPGQALSRAELAEIRRLRGQADSDRPDSRATVSSCQRPWSTISRWRTSPER